MSREVLTALDEAGIGIASATYEISGCRPCGWHGPVRARREGSGRSPDVRPTAASTYVDPHDG